MKINQNFIDDNFKEFKVALFGLSLASVIAFPLFGTMAYGSGMSVKESILLPTIIIGSLMPLLYIAAIIITILEYKESVFIKEVLSEDNNVYNVKSVEFNKKIIASGPSLSLTNELSNLLSESTVKVEFTGIDKKYDLPYSEYLALDGKARLQTQTFLNLWDKEKTIVIGSPEKID